MRFAIITSVWLMIFVSGTALWFKYPNCAGDPGSSTIRTALMLWSLPLMPFAIATFWVPMGFGLYGLLSYLAGLQIVTACWWKMWRIRQTLDAVEAQLQVEAMAAK